MPSWCASRPATHRRVSSDRPSGSFGSWNAFDPSLCRKEKFTCNPLPPRSPSGRPRKVASFPWRSQISRTRSLNRNASSAAGIASAYLMFTSYAALSYSLHQPSTGNPHRIAVLTSSSITPVGSTDMPVP